MFQIMRPLLLKSQILRHSMDTECRWNVYHFKRGFSEDFRTYDRCFFLFLQIKLLLFAFQFRVALNGHKSTFVRDLCARALSFSRLQLSWRRPVRIRIWDHFEHFQAPERAQALPRAFTLVRAQKGAVSLLVHRRRSACKKCDHPHLTPPPNLPEFCLWRRTEWHTHWF